MRRLVGGVALMLALGGCAVAPISAPPLPVGSSPSGLAGVSALARIRACVMQQGGPVRKENKEAARAAVGCANGTGFLSLTTQECADNAAKHYTTLASYERQLAGCL